MIGDMRQTRKTPAVTMVAAWISADTGVGPSIASGNQVCRNNCADFPMAPKNSNMPMVFAAFNSRPMKLMVCSARCGPSARITLKLMLSVSL